MVASTPSPSPPASSKARATADSLTPNSRSTCRPGGCVRASSSRIGSLASAFGQSRRSSPGGPGRTTTTQPVGARKTSPGAVPARPIETAGAGLVACFVTPEAKSPYGLRSRSATAREIDSISCSSASSTTSSSPAARATTSTVRSSCVGPRPPETRHASASNPSRRAVSSSSGESPTIVIRAGSRPFFSASAARNGPFRSVRSPRTSSLPVTTTSARGRSLTREGESSAAV